MPHDQAEQRFHSDEDAKKKNVDSWLVSKDVSFFRHGIQMLPDGTKAEFPIWEKKRTLAMDYTFIKMFLAYFFKIKHYFS